eukprot:GHUV01058669.1.p1 GENE.GHUV01058669.1~~GHUV01058669.1.p1  ORF type:complete len:102 (+),score=8.17 GHUV01058669.1:150-455(+)
MAGCTAQSGTVRIDGGILANHAGYHGFTSACTSSYDGPSCCAVGQVCPLLFLSAYAQCMFLASAWCYASLTWFNTLVQISSVTHDGRYSCVLKAVGLLLLL